VIGLLTLPFLPYKNIPIVQVPGLLSGQVYPSQSRPYWSGLVFYFWPPYVGVWLERVSQSVRGLLLELWIKSQGLRS